MIRRLLTLITALDPTDERLIIAAHRLGYVTVDPEPERDRLTALLAEIDARATMLADMLTDGRMTPEQWSEIATPILTDQTATRAALAALPTGVSVDVGPLLDLCMVDDWSTVPDETWRALLVAFEITVTLGRLTPDDEERRRVTVSTIVRSDSNTHRQV